MAGSKICGSSNMTVLLQNDKVPCSSEVLESFWIPTRTSTLQGSKSMVNFENVHGGDTITETPFFRSIDKEENGDDDFDDCFHPPGKKRRLTASQVQFLEKNFEVENKLEPERKIQLAKELGLQPRQVAIWFQNRRARFKNKQLEKDFESLKANYDKLKADYDTLLKEKEDLKNEVLSLKDKLLMKDTGKENIIMADAINTSNGEPQKATTADKVIDSVVDVAMVVCKQEDASSAKSDVFDSDSPHCTEGNHSSSLIEPADSSNVFEPEQSDFSQDEDDNLSRSLFQPPFFPKVEEDGCYDDPPANSCNFGFSVEDQPFWSWNY